MKVLTSVDEASPRLSRLLMEQLSSLVAMVVMDKQSKLITVMVS